MTLKLAKQHPLLQIDLFQGFTQYLESNNTGRISTHMKNLNLFVRYMLADPDFFNRRSLVDACTYYVNSYLRYLGELMEASSFSRSTISSRIKSIDLLFQFLNTSGLSDYRMPSLNSKSKENKKIQNKTPREKYSPNNEYKPSSSRTNQLRKQCVWFHNYLTQCEKRNAPAMNDYKYKTAYFIHFLVKSSATNDINEILESLTPTLIKQFELHLMQKINLEEIEMSTAYIRLRYVKYFLEYLRKQKVIMLKYNIPSVFSSKGSRSNEYVKSQDLEKVIDTLIASKSPYILRNLAIILLLAETGCRPIEIANLELLDVDFIESTIRFTSVKSNTRTLRIHKTVMDIVKKYFNERSQAKTDVPYLFLLDNGKRIYTEMIGNIIAYLNYRAFSEIRFSAKSLRHTYATNALNNGNDFDDVSKSMGHKHWVSTMHYVYRSVKRLLSNTLPYDPTI